MTLPRTATATSPSSPAPVPVSGLRPGRRFAEAGRRRSATRRRRGRATHRDRRPDLSRSAAGRRHSSGSGRS